MTLKKTMTVAMLALALMATPALARGDLWLHVTIDSPDGENGNLTFNLPLDRIEDALAMLPDEGMRDGTLGIDDAPFDVATLRPLWHAMRNAPDTTFVTVQSNDANVRVFKEAGYLKATVDEQSDGTRIDARLPLTVVDALLSGNDDELNLRAALEALAEHGPGELVTVDADNARVRAWIDDDPDA